MLVSLRKLSSLNRDLSPWGRPHYSRRLKARALSPSRLKIGGREHDFTSKNVFTAASLVGPYISMRECFSSCVFGWLFHCV